MVNLKTIANLMWKYASGRASAADTQAVEAAGYNPDDLCNPRAWGTQWNEFRICDALEFARAYDLMIGQPEALINARLDDLSKRMDSILADGKQVATYLLAAYRGYEAAMCAGRTGAPPAIVKLDDSAPDMIVREAWYARALPKKEDDFGEAAEFAQGVQ